jgi:hypothetical protein
LTKRLSALITALPHKGKKIGKGEFWELFGNKENGQYKSKNYV